MIRVLNKHFLGQGPTTLEALKSGLAKETNKLDLIHAERIKAQQAELKARAMSRIQKNWAINHNGASFPNKDELIRLVESGNEPTLKLLEGYKQGIIAGKRNMEVGEYDTGFFIQPNLLKDNKAFFYM